MPPSACERVAVDRDLHLAERDEIRDGPQRPADQPLDLLGPAALLAPRGLRGRPARPWSPGSIEYSAVTQPSTLAAQPRRHPLLDRRGAQHAGPTHLDEDRAHRELRVVAGERERSQLVGLAPVLADPHGRLFRRADRGQISVIRCGTASVTGSPNASDPSATEASGSTWGQMWVSTSRWARASRAASPAWRAERWIGDRDVVVEVATPPTARGPRRSRTRRRSTPGRCPRCRSSAGPAADASTA